MVLTIGADEVGGDDAVVLRAWDGEGWHDTEERGTQNETGIDMCTWLYFHLLLDRQTKVPFAMQCNAMHLPTPESDFTQQV